MYLIEFFSYFLLLAIMGLANASGSGGGGIVIPIALSLYNFDTKTSIALSNCNFYFIFLLVKKRIKKGKGLYKRWQNVIHGVLVIFNIINYYVLSNGI